MADLRGTEQAVPGELSRRAGGDPQPPQAPEPTAGPAAPPSSPGEQADAEGPPDWMTELQERAEARAAAVREAAAELRAAAAERGQQSLAEMGEKPAALRQEIERVLALLRGPALAELAGAAGADGRVAALLETIEETREMAGAFEQSLPDTERLANPPEFDAELPDPQQELEKSRQEGAEPDPAEFESRFMETLEQSAEQLLADYEAALDYQPPALDADALEQEMQSLLPSVAIMVIEGMEDIAEAVDAADVTAWCEKHLQEVRCEFADAVGLVELPVKKGEPFNPALHRAASDEPLADEQQRELRNTPIAEIVRPGYCLGSSSAQPLRPATVKVAA